MVNKMSQFSENASRSITALAVDGAPLSQEKENRQRDRHDKCQELGTSTHTDTSMISGALSGAGVFASPGRPSQILFFSGPCQTSSCSCLRGRFTSFDGKCNNCPHNMARHPHNIAMTPFDISTPY